MGTIIAATRKSTPNTSMRVWHNASADIASGHGFTDLIITSLNFSNGLCFATLDMSLNSLGLGLGCLCVRPGDEIEVNVTSPTTANGQLYAGSGISVVAVGSNTIYWKSKTGVDPITVGGASGIITVHLPFRRATVSGYNRPRNANSGDVWFGPNIPLDTVYGSYNANFGIPLSSGADQQIDPVMGMKYDLATFSWQNTSANDGIIVHYHV